MIDRRIIKKIDMYVQAHQLFDGVETVVVACSGGPDSVFLVQILSRYFTKNRLTVVYFDHQLRPKKSINRDLKVIKELGGFAKEILIELLPVKAVALENKLSLEMAGRNLRRKRLGDLAKQRSAAIAFGHHLDDYCETMMLQLLRGAKAGLQGILPKTTLENGVPIVRPLLGTTKEEIIKELSRNHTAFSVDETNAESDFLRNKIRRELMPIFADLAPSYRYQFQQHGTYISELNSFLDDLLFSTLGQRLSVSEYDRRILKNLPRFLQNHWALRVLEHSQVSPSYEQITQMVNAVNSNSGKTIKLGRDLMMEAMPQKVVFQAPKPHPETVHERLTQVPGRQTFPTLGFSLKIRCLRRKPPTSQLKSRGTEVHVDWDLILEERLLLRSRKTGDRFRPIGAAGSKSLQDYFVDQKIPRQARLNLPILCTAEEIIWVLGFQVGEKYRVRPATKRVAILSIGA